MKYYETLFEEYIKSSEISNLHPKLLKIQSKFPNDINKLTNCLFYGPPGSGKYTQVLKFIKPYSQSNLKYEKKITVIFNKNQYFFKISDIHVEIDMGLLGCNSKLIWNEFYNQIIDISLTKPNHRFIILCKNFHDIHSELLEDFYSYMQNISFNSVELIYFIISEKITFLPQNIINTCQLIHISKPSKLKINTVFKTNIKHNILDISNLKDIKDIKNNNDIVKNKEEFICKKIIDSVVNINDLDYGLFRDLLYEIFIFDLDLYNCIWYVLSNLIKTKHIKDNDCSDILIKTCVFLKYFNNNYRPIYHLENYMFYLIKKIHGI